MKIETRKNRRNVILLKKGQESFWKGKSAEELAKEQGIKPLHDLSRISGGFEDWDDIDVFLKEVRKPQE